MFYIVVLVCVQQSESSVCIHIAPLFCVPFSFRSPQSSEYSPSLPLGLTSTRPRSGVHPGTCQAHAEGLLRLPRETTPLPAQHSMTRPSVLQSPSVRILTGADRAGSSTLRQPLGWEAEGCHPFQQSLAETRLSQR